jgi:hypothetical protein
MVLHHVFSSVLFTSGSRSILASHHWLQLTRYIDNQGYTLFHVTQRP